MDSQNEIFLVPSKKEAIKYGKLYEKIAAKIREDGYFNFGKGIEWEHDVTRSGLLSTVIILMNDHDDWKVKFSKTEPHVIYLYDTSREGLELK